MPLLTFPFMGTTSGPGLNTQSWFQRKTLEKLGFGGVWVFGLFNLVEVARRKAGFASLTAWANRASLSHPKEHGAP